MGEDVRLVEMEYINDIGIGQRLEENHVVIVVPSRAGGDDRFRGSPRRMATASFASTPYQR